MRRFSVLSVLAKKGAISAVMLLFVFSAAYPAKIRDFAPLQIGNTWVYSYYFFNNINGPDVKDSSIVTIKIQSKSTQGIDTLYYINVRNQRFKNILSDTNYITSLLVREDSIITGNYQCPVFPFWPTHGIDIDSLKKIKIGSDSIYEYFYSFNHPTGRAQNLLRYIQNIGLIVKIDDVRGLWGDRKNHSTLLSFNGNHIPVSVKPFSINAPSLYHKTLYFLRISMEKARFDANSMFFSLNGKILSPRRTRTQGIIIDKELTPR